RLAAFRAIEEALGNAVRHGRATAVHIALDLVADQYLTVTVRDDGCGFDPGQARPGLGLSSIESWGSQEGRRWQIASRPGGGTAVVARLPLTPVASPLPPSRGGPTAGAVPRWGLRAARLRLGARPPRGAGSRAGTAAPPGPAD